MFSAKVKKAPRIDFSKISNSKEDIEKAVKHLPISNTQNLESFLYEPKSWPSNLAKKPTGERHFSRRPMHSDPSDELISKDHVKSLAEGMINVAAGTTTATAAGFCVREIIASRDQQHSKKSTNFWDMLSNNNSEQYNEETFIGYLKLIKDTISTTSDSLVDYDLVIVMLLQMKLTSIIQEYKTLDAEKSNTLIDLFNTWIKNLSDKGIISNKLINFKKSPILSNESISGYSSVLEFFSAETDTIEIRINPDFLARNNDFQYLFAKPEYINQILNSKFIHKINIDNIFSEESNNFVAINGNVFNGKEFYQKIKNVFHYDNNINNLEFNSSNSGIAKILFDFNIDNFNKHQQDTAFTHALDILSLSAKNDPNIEKYIFILIQQKLKNLNINQQDIDNLNATLNQLDAYNNVTNDDTNIYTKLTLYWLDQAKNRGILNAKTTWRVVIPKSPGEQNPNQVIDYSEYINLYDEQGNIFVINPIECKQDGILNIAHLYSEDEHTTLIDPYYIPVPVGQDHPFNETNYWDDLRNKLNDLFTQGQCTSSNIKETKDALQELANNNNFDELHRANFHFNSDSDDVSFINRITDTHPIRTQIKLIAEASEKATCDQNGRTVLSLKLLEKLHSQILSHLEVNDNKKNITPIIKCNLFVKLIERLQKEGTISNKLKFETMSYTKGNIERYAVLIEGPDEGNMVSNDRLELVSDEEVVDKFTVVFDPSTPSLFDPSTTNDTLSLAQFMNSKNITSHDLKHIIKLDGSEESFPGIRDAGVNLTTSPDFQNLLDELNNTNLGNNSTSELIDYLEQQKQEPSPTFLEDLTNRFLEQMSFPNSSTAIAIAAVENTSQLTVSAVITSVQAVRSRKHIAKIRNASELYTTILVGERKGKTNEQIPLSKENIKDLKSITIFLIVKKNPNKLLENNFACKVTDKEKLVALLLLLSYHKILIENEFDFNTILKALCTLVDHEDLIKLYPKNLDFTNSEDVQQINKIICSMGFEFKYEINLPLVKKFNVKIRQSFRPNSNTQHPIKNVTFCVISINKLYKTLKNIQFTFSLYDLKEILLEVKNDADIIKEFADRATTKDSALLANSFAKIFTVASSFLPIIPIDSLILVAIAVHELNYRIRNMRDAMSSYHNAIKFVENLAKSDYTVTEKEHLELVKNAIIQLLETKKNHMMLKILKQKVFLCTAIIDALSKLSVGLFGPAFLEIIRVTFRVVSRALTIVGIAWSRYDRDMKLSGNNLYGTKKDVLNALVDIYFKFLAKGKDEKIVELTRLTFSLASNAQARVLLQKPGLYFKRTIKLSVYTPLADQDLIEELESSNSDAEQLPLNSLAV